MLRQRLIITASIAAVLATVNVPARASRPAEVNDAQGAVATTLRGNRTILQGADSSKAQTAAAKEMARIAGVQPAAAARLGHVSTAPAHIDMDALMAKYSRLEGPGGAGATHRPRLLIFISSSMPEASLKALARDAIRIGAPLILRGIVGTGFPSTARFMMGVLGANRKRKSQVPSDPSVVRAMIDPVQFRRFDVRTVPAFVLVPDGACLGHACPTAVPDNVHVAGDVTLDYALAYIGRTHPAVRPVAARLLASLRGGRQ